jgi:hypothetical protein
LALFARSFLENDWPGPARIAFEFHPIHERGNRGRLFGF